MNMRFDLSSHLGKEIFNSLRSAPFQPYLLDYGIPKVKSFNRGLVLALSLLFSKDFKIFPKGSRIGVILPPGIAGFVSNFALLLTGRVPVNLNFTMGKELNLEVLQCAGVTTVVTASKMMK
jgi:acyl-[acyl-carrier-protein]-phospholipid O-acyltransferase/long-chain-fatty-acid--[acyl-carrier-protein] ligase